MAKCSSLLCSNEAPEGRKFCVECEPSKPHKCRHLPCTADAVPGSAYCPAHQSRESREGIRSIKEPAGEVLTPLGEAQVRVAKAQEERDRLHQEVMQKYGALHELDGRCALEQSQDSCATYNGKAHRLRIAYNNAVKELRLAKSALERMRNEARQAEERPAPAKRPDEVAAPKASTPAPDDAPPAPAPWWEGGPLDTVRGMPWHVAVQQVPAGRVVRLKPGRYIVALNNGAAKQVDLSKAHELHGPLTPWQAVTIAEHAEGFAPEERDAPTPTELDTAPDAPAEVKAWYRCEAYDRERVGTAESVSRALKCQDCDDPDCDGPEEIPEEDLSPEQRSWGIGDRAPERIVLEDAHVEHGAIVATATPELREALPSGEGIATVVGPDGKGGMVLDLKEGPAEQPKAVQHDLDGKPAEKPKPKEVKQTDLNRDELKLPWGVIEEEVISRRRKYKDGFYKLALSVDDLLSFNALPLSEKERIVSKKLRPEPGPDDHFDKDLLPDEVDRFVRILSIASINLNVERETAELKAAMAVI